MLPDLTFIQYSFDSFSNLWSWEFLLSHFWSNNVALVRYDPTKLLDKSMYNIACWNTLNILVINVSFRINFVKLFGHKCQCSHNFHNCQCLHRCAPLEFALLVVEVLVKNHNNKKNMAWLSLHFVMAVLFGMQIVAIFAWCC